MTATKNVARFSLGKRAGNQLRRGRKAVQFQRIFARDQGVIVLVGYGIKIHVDRGHLTIEDGICDDRRQGRFPRVHHGLRRLVVVGADGFISLAAIQWLADQKISFAMLERDGAVLLNTGPLASSDARLRRAQACAQHQPIANEIVRYLIDLKLAGQEAIARNQLRNASAADLIARHRSYLETSNTIDDLRICEANGAGVYWTAWQSVPVQFPKSDLPRIPEHWLSFGTRRSPISNTSRRPPNPVNAILNYLYTLLESETRLAINALGLDAGFGLLHLDHGTRDSLVYDLMEPIRPKIDAYVFDWISTTPLKRSWFFEQRDGSCRLMSDLTVQLSDTASTWAREVAPIVEWYAEMLSASLSDKGVPAASTRLTRRKRFEGKGSEVPEKEAARKQNRCCVECGALVGAGTARCPQCAPKECGRRIAAAAVKGRVAAKSPEVQALKSAKMRAHREAIANWNPAELPEWLDEEFFLTKVRPALNRVRKQVIADALGINVTVAYKYVKGTRIPHKRHWLKLAELAGAKERIVSDNPVYRPQCVPEYNCDSLSPCNIQ